MQEKRTQAHEKANEEIAILKARLAEAEETLRAIREGEVDALVVYGPDGNQIYTLQNAERPYRALVEAMMEGAVTLSDDGLILYGNQRFADMLHLPLEKVLGGSIYTFVADKHHFVLHKLLQQHHLPNRRAEIALQAADGTEIPVLAALGSVPLDNVLATCLVATDLTVQQQREQELVLLQRLQASVNEADTLEAALHVVLHGIATAMHWVYGEAWTLSGDQAQLERSAAFHNGNNAETLTPDWQEIVVNAWNSKQVIVLPDAHFVAEHHAAVVVPVKADSEVVTVLAFFAPESRDIDEHFIRVVSMMADQLGAFIRRKQMEEDLRRAGQELEGRVSDRTAELQRTNVSLKHEIAERTRVAEQIAELQEVTTAFSAALTPVEVSDVMVRLGLKMAGAARGAILILSDDGKFLRLLNAKSCSDQQMQAWQNLPVIASSGVLAKTVLTREPQWGITREQIIPNYTAHTSPIGRDRWAAVPLSTNEHIIGALALGFPRATEFDNQLRGFILTLAKLCAQALHRAQLYEQVQLAAAIEERQRLARDLHDAVTQTLFSASITAEALPRLWQRNPDAALSRLGEVVRLTRGASAEMRALLLELRPASLVNNELGTLITQLIQAIQGRKKIDCSITVDQPYQPLPTDVHIALYRIAQEGLNNIVKHANATKVNVFLSSTPELAELRIQDNGTGFDLDNYKSGLGLGMMAERAEAVGATLSLSSAAGQGTEIRVIRPAVRSSAQFSA